MLVPLRWRFRGRLRSGVVVCLKCGFRARGEVSALASCGQIWILFGFFFFFPASRLFQPRNNPPKRPLAAFLSSEPRGYSVPFRRRERSREGQEDAVISRRSKYFGGRNGGRRGGCWCLLRQAEPLRGSPSPPQRISRGGAGRPGARSPPEPPRSPPEPPAELSGTGTGCWEAAKPSRGPGLPLPIPGQPSRHGCCEPGMEGRLQPCASPPRFGAGNSPPTPTRWFARLWVDLGTRPRNSSVFPL